LLVLLFLNKTNDLLEQQEDASRKAKAAFAGILGRALPSNHEKVPLKPRVDFPQITWERAEMLFAGCFTKVAVGTRYLQGKFCGFVA
jgi:hypothetical protein